MMTILVDDREKLPYDFKAVNRFYSKKVDFRTILQRLPLGDYSILGMENSVAVERKSLTDLFSSLSSLRNGRSSLQRRIICLKRYRIKAVVIEASVNEILTDPPRFSKLSPHSVLGTVMAWQSKYNVPFVFADNRCLAEICTFMILRQAVKLV